MIEGLSETQEHILNQVEELHGSAHDVLLQVVKLLQESFPSWNWVGLYLLKDGRLILGPYVGKPTDHTEIEIGVGVCGSAVQENTNIIVDDVTRRDNYLACTLETRSEIVVLIRDGETILGQFDIDSDSVANFTKEDERLLESLAVVVAPHVSKLVTV